MFSVLNDLHSYNFINVLYLFISAVVTDLSFHFTSAHLYETHLAKSVLCADPHDDWR